MSCDHCGADTKLTTLLEYAGPHLPMVNRGSLCRRCESTLMDVMEGAAMSSDGFLQSPCDHGLTFDASAARGKTVEEVRQRWPRLDGTCPKGCGFHGVKYVNVTHYVAGGWHRRERT